MILTILMGILFSGSVFATEKIPYQVLKKDGQFEVRKLSTYLSAEVVVEADATEAGNRAFRVLFNFIDGKNSKKQSIPMTAPVVQSAAGPKKHTVSFVMPSSQSMQSIPTPNDTRVNVVEIPSQKVASIRYSGTWSKENYQENLNLLQEWMRKNKLKPIGKPLWARYDAPMMPWFLRRNEIWIPVSEN